MQFFCLTFFTSFHWFVPGEKPGRFSTDPRHELKISQKVGLKYISFLSEEGNDYTDRRHNENAPMQFILILIYENNFKCNIRSQFINTNLESAIKKRATFFLLNYTISIVLGTTILEQNQKQKSEVCGWTIVLKLQEIHTNCPKLTEGCVVYVQIFLGKGPVTWITF